MRRFLIALVALLAACGSSTPHAATTTPPPTITAPSTSGPTTTGPTTTAAATTTSAASTTTTVPATTTTIVGAADWTPPCRETPAGPPVASGPYGEEGLDRFGPLAAQASLDITLPTNQPFPGNPPGPVQASVNASRVEGGVLVGVSHGEGTARTSILAVVGADGSKRWVRCVGGPLAGVWVAPPATQPATALVGVQGTWTSTSFPTYWRIVSLADGSAQPGFDDAARRAGIDPATLVDDAVFASSDTALLLGHGPVSQDNADRLVRYDLVTNEMARVPVPPEARSTTTGSVQFSFGAQGDIMVSTWMAASSAEPAVRAVYRAGAWTRDPAVLRAARPITVTFGGEPRVLEGVDAAGRVVWSDPRFMEPTLQGVSITTDGPVTVATVCTARAPVGDCASQAAHSLVGVATDTGVVVWALPGFRFVPAVADGWVLTQDADIFASRPGNVGPGYVLLDDRTAKAVDPTQHWSDPETFRQGCCGEFYVSVSRAGGVLFARNARHLRVWYPKGAAPAPHTVSLP